MKRRTKWNASSVITLIIGAGMILAALIMLVPSLLDYKKSDDTYKDLKEEYVAVEEKTDQKESEEETNKNWWYEDVDIDLTGLQQENSDIVG